MSAAPEPLMTPAEVAQLFRVTEGAVARWAQAGKLTPIKTPTNRNRYRESEVMALLNGGAK